MLFRSKRLHAHVGQPCDGAGRVVGVQRGQHQVARQAGLNGDLRRFRIADFANHHHVRVLPQDGAQRAGKGEFNARVHLRLPHARQVVFDGVFHRHDVAVRRIQPRQAGVQRGRFAAACGAGHQNDAVRLVYELLKALQHAALHAHGFQREAAFRLVQQAQHRPLAMRAGQGRYAHVDGPRAQPQADAAILRQALFGNVQLGHDLQAADERGVQRAVGLHHLAQRAVHAKAHAGVALVRLNVNVARAIARGLREQRVEHADDGRVVRRLQQVFHGRQLLHDAREVHVRLHV